MLNKIQLIGRVGQTIELKSTQSGQPYCNVSIATSEKYKGRDGQLKEETQWHRVNFFGKQAETLAKFSSKGSQLYIEGKMQYRKYTGKDGIEKNIAEIAGREFKFIGANQSPASTNSYQSGSESNQDYSSKAFDPAMDFNVEF